MKYLIACLACLVAVTVYSQSTKESVIQPVYEYLDDEYIQSDDANGSFTQSTMLAEKTTENLSEQELDLPKSTSSGDIEITTELGTTTIDIRDGVPVPTLTEPERLDQVVDSINKQYQADTKNCQIGSWLSRVWCRMTSWF